jgi:hypothetical protein
VYRARADLIISFPFADCQLRDTFCRGKIIAPESNTVSSPLQGLSSDSSDESINRMITLLTTSIIGFFPTGNRRTGIVGLFGRSYMRPITDERV